MRKDLQHVVSDWVKSLSTNTAIIIGYSGGRDSHVLLHILCQLRVHYPLRLRAIHINHGLQKAAQQWAEHCQKVCESYDIPFTLIPLQLTIPAGESLENFARENRYAAFSQFLSAQDILVTAHTEDDQAETFLLQLLRGSGPLGLSGISSLKKLGKGELARPLLTVSKKKIAAYALAHQLNWIEDPTNADTRFRRNFLRHEILPKLECLDSGVIASISRSSQHCANTQQLLEEYLRPELIACLGTTRNSIELSVFKKYSRIKQEALFRLWLKDQGVLTPSTKKLSDILEQMLMAKRDASPCVTWGNRQVRRYQDQLYLLRLLPDPSTTKPSNWLLVAPLILSSDSIWQAKLVQGKRLSVKKISAMMLACRFREGGERCRPQGLPHSSSLKKILQQYQVPTWERQVVPLFYHQDTLVAVGDLFICEGWQVGNPEEEGWLIEKVN